MTPENGVAVLTTTPRRRYEEDEEDYRELAKVPGVCPGTNGNQDILLLLGLIEHV